MKKKFKVRVRHYTRDMYKIQWAHYYLIPFYWTIFSWSDGGGLLSGTHGWVPILYSAKDAEIVAGRFKSIEDVRRWDEKEELKREAFYKKRDEYQKERVPYLSKTIIK